ncbi:MerR family transcriptional regulator [Desertibaculum subflavum]|uniref:MerR family transcriptional regulator n=1 Tax=Desertibaculum subflavum TaxID=2268458 RepID=UPI000E671083
MFRIGEFSRIARVSGRLLRYYDSIGLLSPQRVDPATGYRYYTADQLGRLNRVLALKELGLTLDQVARLLEETISVEEIRGMLTLRKAELERSLGEQAARLRHVESRLQQIDEQGRLADYDVVLKPVAAQSFLALRRTFAGMDEAVATLRELARETARQVPIDARGALVVVAHSDFEDEQLDLEIGFVLARSINRRIATTDGRALAIGELPAVDRMATLVRRGPDYQSHLAFGALGLWMDANDYAIAGPGREVFLELPFQRPDQHDTVMEIQFPVARAA